MDPSHRSKCEPRFPLLGRRNPRVQRSRVEGAHLGYLARHRNLPEPSRLCSRVCPHSATFDENARARISQVTQAVQIHVCFEAACLKRGPHGHKKCKRHAPWATSNPSAPKKRTLVTLRSFEAVAQSGRSEDKEAPPKQFCIEMSADDLILQAKLHVARWQ